VLNIMAD